MFCPHGGVAPGRLTCFTLPALLSSARSPMLADVTTFQLPIVWTLAVFAKAWYLSLHCLIYVSAFVTLNGRKVLGRKRNLSCNQLVGKASQRILIAFLSGGGHKLLRGQIAQRLKIRFLREFGNIDEAGKTKV